MDLHSYQISNSSQQGGRNQQVQFNVLGHFSTGRTMGYIDGGTVDETTQDDMLFHNEEKVPKQRLKFDFSASTHLGKLRGVGQATFERVFLVVELKYFLNQTWIDYIYVCTNSKDKNTQQLEEAIRSDLSVYETNQQRDSINFTTTKAQLSTNSPFFSTTQSTPSEQESEKIPKQSTQQSVQSQESEKIPKESTQQLEQPNQTEQKSEITQTKQKKKKKKKK